MKEPLIKFENFGFKYNAQSKPTLYDINLEIAKGERVLIAGPSGCGKSTLVHCINGLIPFSYKGEQTGSLTLKGKEMKDLSLFDISKSVGTVLQDSDAQFVGLTVAEDIAFALENDCVPAQQLHQRVEAVSEIVDMKPFLTHAPGELSGGQKQRVSMAGIMVDEVDLMLFDEPLANLDPKTGKTAIELIDEIQEKSEVAVVIVEHRLEDVLHRSVDRIVLMQEGRIIADTTPEKLLSGSFLPDSGIREPLYLTALKYSGVDIREDMQPAHIDTLRLTENDINKVTNWYEKSKSQDQVKDQEVILCAENVTFFYDNGHHALKGINLSVNEGEMLAIVGTNGAGKSTFSKVVCGFESNQGGNIYFQGESILPLSIKERADKIGYVMQNPNQMISKVMIYDEVALGLRTRGVPEDEIKTRVDNALKICGLWPFRNWPISALSFGQKKRVTIASILVLEPKIIILDEPTAGQDYRHYTKMMEFLTELNQSGITVIMITHDMHLMLEYADRAVVFSDGQVIADKTGAQVLTDKDIISRASLKETSLYNLALKCNIDSPTDFVNCFIEYERANERAKEAGNE